MNYSYEECINHVCNRPMEARKVIDYANATIVQLVEQRNKAFEAGAAVLGGLIGMGMAIRDNSWRYARCCKWCDGPIPWNNVTGFCDYFCVAKYKGWDFERVGFRG